MRLLEQGRAFGDEGLALSPVLRDLLCDEREVACEVLELVVRLDSEWLHRLVARQTPRRVPDPENRFRELIGRDHREPEDEQRHQRRGEQHRRDESARGRPQRCERNGPVQRQLRARRTTE